MKRRPKKPTVASGLDMYRGEMRRANFTDSTIASYSSRLDKFAGFVGYGTPLRSVTSDDCRGYMDTFTNHAPGTIGLAHTVLSSWFRFLVLNDFVKLNPMDRVRRPRVPALADRKRTRVSTDEVRLMLGACETWPERMCLYMAAYTGARRNALSEVRWRDVNLELGTVAFLEKGRKRIEKPMARELRRVIDEYLFEHPTPRPDDFVIPNKVYTGRPKRQNRIIWTLVKEVASRVGVTSHVHSLRAAFAVHYLECNPDKIEDLRTLMGHGAIGTTQGYLDEYNKRKAMEAVRGLSFKSDPEEAA